MSQERVYSGTKLSFSGVYCQMSYRKMIQYAKPSDQVPTDGKVRNQFYQVI